jgi:hypothetical protein
MASRAGSPGREVRLRGNRFHVTRTECTLKRRAAGTVFLTVSTSVQRWVSPAGLGAFLASILLISGACSPAHSRRTSPSPAAAVSGFYEGALQSREHGEVPFSANLRDENGRVAGTLSTPLGDFPVSQESLTPEEITLRFALGDGEVGTIAARWAPGRSAETGS